MGSVTLQPGAVFLRGPFRGALPDLGAHADSAVVGSAPQWADSNDSTYATIHRESDVILGYFGTDAAVAPLPDIDVAPASIQAVKISLRWSADVDGLDCDPVIRAADESDAIGLLESPAAAVAGVLYEGTFSFDIEGVDLAPILVPAASLWIQVSSGTGGFTIYEASIGIDLSGPVLAAPALRHRAAPLRQYPRSDGLGMSSHPRLYPPPRSAQASNRRAGGYN